VKTVSFSIFPKTQFIANQIVLPYSGLKYNLDILHTLVAAPLLIRPHASRYILTVHDLAHEKPSHSGDGVMHYYWKYVMRYGIRNADRILAVSQSTKRDIREIYKVNGSKIDVVYNTIGVNFDNKESYNSYDNGAYFLHVGTICERKNIPNLLRAFGIFLERCGKDVKLFLVGRKGNATEKTMSVINSLGLRRNVEILGYVDNNKLSSLYANAVSLVFPSLYEGFGYPALESMIHETPVIASDVSSLPEVVGDTGILVDPSEPSDIAKSMYRVYRNVNLRREMASKGYERAQSFNSSNMVDNTFNTYKCALE
jgi:glycosyltransferase involved in cell wall biosynthesis